MQSDGNISLTSIHEAIIGIKNELKNAIEASEARVLLKLETVNKKVTKLEKENKQLKDKIEILERQHKRNNIIIFGINKPAHEISAEYICHEINSLLEINLVEEDISDVYPLGRTANRPIKVELLSQLKKKSIIRNCNKLKGKNVSIAHDLTLAQREEAKILRKHLLVARETEENRCYIKGNKLIINNIPYTTRDLEQLQEVEEHTSKKETNSAPPTPNIYASNIYSPSSTDETFDFPLAPKQTQEPPLKGDIVPSQGSSDKEPRKNSSLNTPKSALYEQSVSKTAIDHTKKKPNTRFGSSQKK